jgi:predicted Na+-dependent transporter
LLAVGLDLSRADFARVRHQPRIVAAGLVGPLLVLPPLALLLIAVFSPTTDLRAFATTYFLTEAPLMLGAIILFRRSLQPAS